MLNLIKEQDDIDKLHLYAEDSSEPKYEIFIKRHEDAGIKHLNYLSAFIEHRNTMDDCNNIDNCNPSRKRKLLIVFNDMILKNHLSDAGNGIFHLYLSLSLIFLF